ncbi:MAG: hypothetical protein GWN58_20335 [Anaerolineae bacterium]|nr:hypothetical protein [Anaerolineae bacterium]
MGLDVLFIRDVEAMILAGVVLAVRGAQHQGYDPQFIAGALSQAEHTCIAAKGDWQGLLDQARVMLGADQQGLLDAALKIRAGPGATK